MARFPSAGFELIIKPRLGLPTESICLAQHQTAAGDVASFVGRVTFEFVSHTDTNVVRNTKEVIDSKNRR